MAADRLAARSDPARWHLLATVVIAVITIPAIFFFDPTLVGGGLMFVAVLYLIRGFLFNWTTALFLLAGVIMFIAIRRYRLPLDFAIALEPYRVLIVILLIALALALLANPRFRYQPIAFGWPLAVFFGTAVISIAVNGVELVEAGLVGSALGGLLQLFFLLSVFFIVRQLLTSERLVHLLLVFLTWSGVILALAAMVERFLRVNVFLMLGNVLPLILTRDPTEGYRAGGGRAYASSQHPIALAVLLCMLIPIAIYLAKYAVFPRVPANRQLAYGLAAAALAGGVLCAVSRTAVVVLAVMFLATLLLRPRLAGALLLVGVPVGLLGAVLVPRAFETTVLSFFNVEDLLASQYTAIGWRGQGRLADLQPAFAEVVQAPFFGMGYGSRIVVGDDANSFILDNQVLGWLMETGVVGLVGLAAFTLVPPIRLLVFAMKSGAAPRHAMLAFTLFVSLSGYIAALFFYDAFAFMQTLLVMCILLAVGAWLLTQAPRRSEVDPAPGLSSRAAESGTLV